MDVQDKVVIITGASAGIGLATARLFAEHGAKVALAARSSDKLNALAEELRTQSAEVFVIPTDMRDQTAVRAMIDAVHTHFGRVDILINNAGQAVLAPVEQINVEQYQQIIELNLFGVLYAMQGVIPLMRAQGGGLILNISSSVSKMAIPNIGAYASTKYALNGLTLTARNELAPDNIRVCLMHPGRTATEFGKNALSDPGAGSTVQPGGSTSAALQPPDTAEMVAAKILEAAHNEPVEQFMDQVLHPQP